MVPGVRSSVTGGVAWAAANVERALQVNCCSDWHRVIVQANEGLSFPDHGGAPEDGDLTPMVIEGALLQKTAVATCFQLAMWWNGVWGRMNRAPRLLTCQLDFAKRLLRLGWTDGHFNSSTSTLSGEPLALIAFAQMVEDVTSLRVLPEKLRRK